MKALAALLLLSAVLPAQASPDFTRGAAQPTAVNCAVKGKAVTLPVGPYTPYESLQDLKILKCETVKVGKFTFYTVLMSGEIRNNAPAPQKVMLYDVALLGDKKKLQTVRSEVVDQMELAGDPAGFDLNRSLKREWGEHKTEKSPMLKLEIVSKKENAEPYFIKLNKKQTWMEDL